MPQWQALPFVLGFNVAAWLFLGGRGVLVWSLGQQALDINGKHYSFCLILTLQLGYFRVAEVFWCGLWDSKP